MLNRQIRITCLILFCILSLAACGGAQTEKSSSTTSKIESTKINPMQTTSFNPCTLISREDVGHILGGVVDVRPELSAPLCMYRVHPNADAQPPHAKGPKTADAMNPEQREVLVSVGTSDDASGYLNLDRTNAGKEAKTQVIKGIGTNAFSIPLSTGKAIVVSQGNTIYSITMIYPHMNASLLDTSLINLALSASHTITKNVRPLSVPNPHPCTLLSAQKASQLFQQPVKWYFSVNETGVASCDYISSQGTPHRVQIIAVNKPGVAKTLYNSVDHELESGQKQVLKGIGDAAFYDKQNATWILKGNTVVHLIIMGETPADKFLLPLSRDVVKHF
ncbi:hypothetical protein KDA_29220 [Dictyobacter alpinus]|uniref:DUF4367 domain-containing protein n=1 Tax=Dictyobacter alpinus TaxID=2014873 RepID=A0A402B7W7_9CHLR|nr:DUF3558 domain-containing protein [Dictyobacter alpinus]GCE27438.1 hypothetical protein KDA_29220 [Dictyobacter alpinus]